MKIERFVDDLAQKDQHGDYYTMVSQLENDELFVYGLIDCFFQVLFLECTWYVLL